MTTEQLLEKLLLQIRKDASAYQWHLAIDKVFAEVAAASPGPSPDLRAQIENMEHQFNQRDFVDGADWLPAGEVLVPLADVLALLTPAPDVRNLTTAQVAREVSEPPQAAPAPQETK